MNLLIRIATTVVLLPVLLTLVYLGGWWVFGLCVVVSGLALFEYGNMVLKGDTLGRVVLIVVGTALSCGTSLMESVPMAMASIQLAAIVLATLFVLRTGDFDTAWSRMATASFGILYISVGCFSLMALRNLGDPLPSEWQRPSWLYIAFIATWSNDTFAYFAGRAFGKHKLYEKVSPNKTWEGAIGGVLGTIAMLFFLRYVLFPPVFVHLTSIDLLLIGIPAAFLGPIGDLAESLLKRNYGVKDSGNTIPGHGGMLDRTDALFFVVPWVLLYGVAIRPLLQ